MTTLTIDELTYDRVAKTIDHSLLRPELTLDEVREGCAIAARYDVASVCARPPTWCCAPSSCRDRRGGRDRDRLPARIPQDPDEGVRIRRGRWRDGATELDMVINIGWLRSGPGRRGRGRHPSGGRRGRWSGHREGHPRERLPHARTRSCAAARRWSAPGRTTSRRRPGSRPRRHARRPATDARERVAASEGQGCWWGPNVDAPSR